MTYFGKVVLYHKMVVNNVIYGYSIAPCGQRYKFDKYALMHQENIHSILNLFAEI